MIPFCRRVVQPKGCIVGSMCTVLTLCSGCDLGDYEKRADEERARITYFDNENKLLNDPLDLPQKKVLVIVTNKLGQQEKKLEANAVQKVDVFLRPPKQYGNRISRDDENNPIGGILYRFRGQNDNNVFLAATYDKKKSADEFHNEVRQALIQYYQKEYKLAVQFPLQKTVSDTRRPPKGRRENAFSTTFKTVTYSDGLKDGGRQFQIYFFKSGNDQVAIVFQMASANAMSMSNAIDYSLKTFDTRGAASIKRRAYFARGA
jgi:hypothetical protein